MNIEEMIAAKTRLTQVGAMWSFTLSLLVLAACWYAIWRCVKKAREDRFSEAGMVGLIFGVLALIPAALLCFSAYDYCTAELQARTYVANYQLIELRKQ